MAEPAESQAYPVTPSGRRKKIALVSLLLIVGIGVSAFIAFPSPEIVPEPEKVSVATAEEATRFGGERLTPATHFALIQGLVASPETAGHIYLATFTGLVVGVNSSDLEYEFAYVSQERLDLTGLIVCPEQPNVFYSFGHPSTAEETGIRRSEDWGQTWELVTSRPDPHEWVVSLAKPDVMYAVDFPSLVLVRSDDGGVSWKILESPSRVYSIGIHPQNENVILVGTDNGLYVSEDGGSTWDVASAEMANAIVSAVAYSPHDSKTIYARSFFGLFKSEDEGKSWHLLTDESRPRFLFELVRYIALDNFNPNVVYATAGDVIWKSLDGGQNWFVIREADFRAVGIILPHR